MPGLGFGSRASVRPPLPARSESAERVTYGRIAGYDAGTSGNWFVDGVNGLDTNTGTSSSTPFRTIQKALTMAASASGEQVIRVMGDGVRYREKVSANLYTGRNITIAAYGTDKPWISGANLLTGFVQCTAGDAAVVGANWANVYKATVATSTITHTEYWRCMLSENGNPLDLAQLRANEAVPRFYLDSAIPMFSDAALADLSMSTNPTWYHQITHPSVLGAFTDAQLSQTVASVHAYPNLTGYIRVASVASGVLTLATNSLRPNSGANTGAYALLNVIPAMTQGGWGYRDNGDGTVTFYVWPNDSASLAGGIEIAARKEGIYLARITLPVGITIDGIGVEMCASTATDYSSGSLFVSSPTSATPGQTPTTIRQCHVRNFDGGPGITYKFGHDLTIEHCTVERGRAFGMQTSPNTGATIDNVRVSNCLARDVSQTGFRMFGIRNAAVVDCKSVRTSSGGHANAINFYQGCDRVALVRFIGSYTPSERLWAGYATHQSSSNLLFLNCVFPMAADGRAFVDQTVTTDATNNNFQIVNCWTPHEPALVGAGTGTPGFVLGRSNGGMVWETYNNVTPKISAGGAGNTITRKNNLMTSTGAVAADASETVADYPTVYADAQSSNWAAASGSPLASKAGFDVETLVAAWEGYLPGVDFRKDAFGRAWNPADPGVGPFGTAWAG